MCPMHLPQRHQNQRMSVLEFVVERAGVSDHAFLHMREHITKYHVRHNIDAAHLLEIDSMIDQAFHNLVKPHLEQASAGDLIGVKIIHEALERPIFLSYVHAKDFSSSSFTNRVYAVTQSNTSFLLDGRFDVTVSVIKHVTGGRPPRHRKLNRPVTVAVARHYSKSIVAVPSSGNECGHVAVFLGQYRINNFYELRQWKRFTDKRTRNKALHEAVCRFVLNACKSLGVTLSLKEPVSIATLEQYASFLESKIVVFESQEGKPTSESRLLFVSSNSAPIERNIYLELLNRDDSTSHYNLITKPASYFQAVSFCHNCFAPFDRVHSCRYSECNACKAPKRCEDSNSISCSNCGQVCFGDMCLQEHQKLKQCRSRYMCSDCLVVLPAKLRSSHRCLEYFCKTCSVTYTCSPHYCFIRPLSLREDENVVLVVFDIESMFVTNREGADEHVPILLVSLTVCNECYISNNTLRNSPGDSKKFLPMKTKDCSICLSFLHVFRGKECVRQFCDYIYITLAPHASRVKRNMQVRVMAHNLKGYDGRFILRDYFSRNFESSNIIMQGTKVLCLDVANVRFQDSLNLFMCPLRKLPATFGFCERVTKGEFPYLFNRPENSGYVGKVPAIEYFGFENMKPSDQKALQAFYDGIKHRTDYDLQHEMEQYCFADTEILLIAVMSFREKFKSIAGFDPIRRYFTLPSMSMATFRGHFLKEKTLAVTPINPYSANRSCSTISKIYLDYIEVTDKITLMREYRLGKVYADGFHESTQTVYEFLGCLYHGCPSCFTTNRSTEHPLTRRTPDALFHSWKEKLEYYNRIKKILLNLNVVYEWECMFRKRVALCPTLMSFYNSRAAYYAKLDAFGPCNLRESYCGGRTENFHFLKDCSSDETVELVDFNSLYPSVLAKYAYPIGHPVVISKDFDDYICGSWINKELFGFVKCKVLPPKQMQIPILPMRFNDRLEFVLCAACGRENAKTFCSHSDDDRCLISTFCTAELAEALFNGYYVVEVFEILHWPVSSDDIFKSYIYKWVKMKTEASGYPSWVGNDADKEAYIRRYYEQTKATGYPIQLDKSAIRKDEIGRNIAKNLLNSFYGKFAEKQNKEHTVVVSDYATLWSIANDADKVITGMITVDTNKLLINWRYTDDSMARSNGIVNIAIASFVTSYARRELWRAMNSLERQQPNCVYYTDTDSIFFSCKRGRQMVKSGHNLGELVREIAPNEEIRQLIVLGPKNYAYVVHNTDSGETRVVIKVKGITLDAQTLKSINIDLLTRMCNEYINNGVTLEKRVSQARIHSSKDQIITSGNMTKVYRAVSEKRLVRGNNTYPKGFVLEE